VHENAVSEAVGRHDADSEMEGRRLFERDLQSFLAAARTARNYLIQRTKEFGCEAWLVQRLASPLFEFHGALADQDMHDHAVSVAKTYDVKWTVIMDVVRLVDGGKPRLIPSPSGPAKLSGLRLTYVEADLEPAVRAAHESIKIGSRVQRGVIELAGDYIHGLREIVRDAERAGLFDSP